jgi:hypothetical protein
MKTLLIALLAATAAWGQAINMTLTGPASYRQNQPFTLVVSATGVSNSSAQQFTLPLPAGVQVTGCTVGAAGQAASKLMFCGVALNTPLGHRFILYGLTMQTINPGQIVAVTINASTNTALTFQLSGTLASDPLGSAISAAGGSVSIPFDASVSRCDLDSNGVVDLIDHTLMRNQLLNAFSAIFDLDGNGGNDVSDLEIVRTAMNGGACNAR